MKKRQFAQTALRHAVSFVRTTYAVAPFMKLGRSYTFVLPPGFSASSSAGTVVAPVSLGAGKWQIRAAGIGSCVVTLQKTAQFTVSFPVTVN